ncbi:unnamed protein product [Urochloa decumbens]|uniref:Uncharacterized protein n=1 Tax=Urochloa decumbens TaxID=240449 RepID=A0ABC9AQ46_9POAL
MVSFSGQGVFNSLHVFLVSIILLLNVSVELCGCYKRIFSFGDDSIIDTGNFANGKGSLMEFPFGMNYFHRPTGRICDGHVLVDFYGEYPSHAEHTIAQFVAYPFAHCQMQRGRSWASLSSYWARYIGGNDYNFWFGDVTKPREVASQFIPDIMATIGSSIKHKSNNNADYDEHGCLRWFNDFSQRHNQELRGMVDRLSAQNPGVKIIYADYYGAAVEFIKDPHRFGIGNPLATCCGGDKQPYHTDKLCNKMARIWGNPSGLASWDGIHMTEKAYEVISQGVLNGPFANPPLLRTC